MIQTLLRLFGLRKRRRVYAQPPVPPPTPVRRRHKSEAAMPLPPGYIQERNGSVAAPPVPPPKRKFGAASMPLPPGHLQGPAITEGEAGEAGAAARGPETPREAKASPMALARALEQPNQAARRSRTQQRPPAAPPVVAPPRRWSPMPALRALWPVWRVRLRRVGRFSVLYVAPLVVVAVMAGLVLREMRNVGIVVMPISVPAAVAASGRTPEVLAQRLVDRVRLALRLTLMDRSARPDDSLTGPFPTVALPAPFLSRRGIASRLRDLFAAPVQRVTGDVVARPDGRLTLRLQMTGAGEIAVQDPISADQLDAGLENVAAQVWRVADPVLYAFYESELEPRPATVVTALRNLLSDPASAPGLAAPNARMTVVTLLGRALARAGDSQGALDAIEGLGGPGNFYAPAWAVRATALLDLGRVQDAMDAQDRVLGLAPGSAWAHKSTAEFYMTIGRTEDAYQQARAARAIAPDDGAAMILESAALIALKRNGEALEVARQAIQRAPAQPGVQEALGNALLAASRPDLALALYDSELKLNPGRINALIGRTRALQLLGRQEEALTAADAALQVMPNNGTAMLLRAWSLLAVKRPQDALAAFDFLLNLRPDMPPLLQGRESALAALGRNAEAIQVLERLMTLVPNNPQLQAELKRLQALPK